MVNKYEVLEMYKEIFFFSLPCKRKKERKNIALRKNNEELKIFQLFTISKKERKIERKMKGKNK